MTTLEDKIEEAFEKSIPGKVSYCVCYLRVSKALVKPYTHGVEPHTKIRGQNSLELTKPHSNSSLHNTLQHPGLASTSGLSGPSLPAPAQISSGSEGRGDPTSQSAHYPTWNAPLMTGHF